MTRSEFLASPAGQLAVAFGRALKALRLEHPEWSYAVWLGEREVERTRDAAGTLPPGAATAALEAIKTNEPASTTGDLVAAGGDGVPPRPPNAEGGSIPPRPTRMRRRKKRASAR